MSIDEIQIDELKDFALLAKKNGWHLVFKSGILYLSNHEYHQDLIVFWEKGNTSWRISKKKNERKNIVPVSKLKYPDSILFQVEKPR